MVELFHVEYLTLLSPLKSSIQASMICPRPQNYHITRRELLHIILHLFLMYSWA